MKKDKLHKDNGGFKIPDGYFETFEDRLQEAIASETDTSPTLDTKISSGFTAPDGYFDHVEESITKAITSQEEEKSILDHKISSGFGTPESYFESLEEKVLQKATKEVPKGKVISIFSKRNLLYISGIAAMIAIIISVSITKGNTDLTDINTLELADIQEYFAEGNVELSNEDIASLLDEETNYTDVFEEKEISEEELLEYLSEEDLEDDIIFTD
ncbi:hypothetical protein [Aquimarina spongiae]|uniref:Uncharacterized protein n=1 Tax=Aquimarina spongiae TaxID=570521 RepID=A0A1M6CCF7_9FLAO|nr:hypothetical protein [Aquimarina spongiae]SHI58689.1 hypothetical protein SAMN04488508_10250 [Aquimarina spongiae]